MLVYWDFETHSTIPISRGTDAYMVGARPLLLSYAVDDGPVELIDFTKSDLVVPPIFKEDATFIAHNAYFDWNVFLHCFSHAIPLSKVHCTKAHALAHSLPGSLGPLCQTLSVPLEALKEADGKRLIRKFCGPHEIRKDEDWENFKEYSKKDVIALREVYKRLPKWNYRGFEKQVFAHDMAVNLRGFLVDTELAQNAIEAVKGAKHELSNKASSLSNGAVDSATRRNVLLDYIRAQGYYLADLRASTVKEALEDETLPAGLAEILRVRLEAAKSSTSKYTRLLQGVSADGRLRGTLQYCGAARTGRWSGRLFQPQNLPRPTMKAADIQLGIDMFKAKQDVSLIAPIIETASNAIRGVLIAPKGKKLLVADYSSIEGRALAWVASEKWVVEAFRSGQDLYKLTYAKAFGIPDEEVDKNARQQGKVMVLALGYAGGVGAFVNMASAYGMDLDALGTAVTVPARLQDKLDWAWDKAVKESGTFGLTKEVYQACDTLKHLYRESNPKIVQLWANLENAVREAVELSDRKERFTAGSLIVDCNSQWLRIQLPSGRYLSYPLPKLDQHGTITYIAWQNKQWRRIQTYSGKLVENVVQAISRDLLAEALINLEKADFPVVIHIHDEVVSEVEGHKTLTEMIKIMTTNPTWASGLPLNAEGFEGIRYEKH